MPRPRHSKTSKASVASGRNQLRIIGGKWRGRKLAFPDGEGLRPTGDRIRETLFNWLMADLPGSCCLDLFAGSGALGLEALSRGASEVCFGEKNPQAATALRSNLALLQANEARVQEGDVLSLLRQSSKPVDIVFIDPPFQANLWAEVIDALQTHGWLKTGSAIYLETPADYPLSVPPNWRLHRHKQTGQVGYQLFYVE